MKRNRASKKAAEPLPAVKKSVPKTPILAAGTVTVRGKGRDLEVLVVHRALRNDWSLPKGKLEIGELMPACAVRETAEETTVQTVLRAPVGTIRYKSLGEPKIVRYWLAQPTDERIAKGEIDFMPGWVPNEEIDEIHWLKPIKAKKILTYSHDVDILERALELSPNTKPLILLRHAEAEKRAVFAERHNGEPPHDHERPLNESGFAQTPKIADVLRAYGITNAISSPAARCVSTVVPHFVNESELKIVDAISELAFLDAPEATRKASREFAANSAALVVVCHRPVLPAMVRAIAKALRIAEPVPKLKPGQFIVIHRPVRQNFKLRKGLVVTEHSGEHTF
jgi:8-oxo-dGTP diphosphatase